jgi:hypothetical protein
MDLMVKRCCHVARARRRKRRERQRLRRPQSIRGALFLSFFCPPKTKTLKRTTKTKRNESNQARAVAFTKTRFVLPFLLDHLHSMLPRGRKRALWRKLQREPEPEPEPEVPLVADGVWLETVNQNFSYILPWLATASHSLSAFWKRDFETELYPDRLRTTGWI